VVNGGGNQGEGEAMGNLATTALDSRRGGKRLPEEALEEKKDEKGSRGDYCVKMCT